MEMEIVASYYVRVIVVMLKRKRGFFLTFYTVHTATDCRALDEATHEALACIF